MLDANDFYPADKQAYKNDLADFNAMKQSWKQDVAATVKLRSAFCEDITFDKRNQNAQHLPQDYRNLALCDLAIGSAKLEAGDRFTAQYMFHEAMDCMKTMRQSGANIDSLIAVSRKAVKDSHK